MPEIAEIARIVYFLRSHVVGRSITSVLTTQDDIVYGKGGTTDVAFSEALHKGKITGVGQRGKYFWLEMDKPPHPVMHFGMTGWISMSTVHTGYHRDPKKDHEWPPKYWKYIIQVDDTAKTCFAFTDPRRLARIRLVDVPSSKLLTTSPLKENGPDPVLEQDVFTEEWLAKRILKKKVPIKALLLDQSVISGIGNWVSDEVLYQSLIHPEQYTHTLSPDQIAALYRSIVDVCETAVSVLADSSKFPAHWLMRYRWSKGKKSDSKLPNGEKISFLTVAGRTSAVVLAVQKKPEEPSTPVMPANRKRQRAVSVLDQDVLAAPIKAESGKVKPDSKGSLEITAPRRRSSRLKTRS